MVGVVHPAGKVGGTWFGHITIFYDISTTSEQIVVVYTIVVELHYSILVIGWYFLLGYRGWMFIIHLRTRVAVCFDGCRLFSDISRGVVLIYTVQTYVMLTQKYVYRRDGIFMSKVG